MSEIVLTAAERARLLECLNNGVEPPADFAANLFPNVCGAGDVRRLNRASIPTIEYAG